MKQSRWFVAIPTNALMSFTAHLVDSGAKRHLSKPLIWNFTIYDNSIFRSHIILDEVVKLYFLAGLFAHDGILEEALERKEFEDDDQGSSITVLLEHKEYVNMIVYITSHLFPSFPLSVSDFNNWWQLCECEFNGKINDEVTNLWPIASSLVMSDIIQVDKLLKEWKEIRP